MLGYIYLLQDGNDIGTDTYKIGKTVQNTDSRRLGRLQAYAPGTVIEAIYRVHPLNIDKIEENIRKTFVEKYTLFRGREWFKGDAHSMMQDIQAIICTFRRQNNESMNERTSAEHDDEAHGGSNANDSNSNGEIQRGTNKYICRRCGHETHRKCNLILHLQKKKECPPTKENVSVSTLIDELVVRVIPDKTYDCEKCGKKFQTRQSKCRHRKTCNGPPHEVSVEEKLDAQQKEIDILKRKLLKLGI